MLLKIWLNITKSKESLSKKKIKSKSLLVLKIKKSAIFWKNKEEIKGEKKSNSLNKGTLLKYLKVYFLKKEFKSPEDFKTIVLLYLVL
jgi:hypothetical protein